jgi:hypothetical protein
MTKRQKNRQHNVQKTEEQTTQCPKDRRTDNTMSKRQKNRQHNVQKNRDKQRSTYEIKDAYPFRATWANFWPVVRFKKQCFKLPLTTLFHCNVPMLLPSINPSTFILFFFVLCTLLCRFLWIVHLLRLAYPIVPVSLDCPFFIGP